MAGSDCAKLRTDRRTPQQGWGAFWQSAARHRGVRRRQPLALGLALGEDVRALPPPHRRPCRLRSGPGLSLNPLSHETCLAHTQGTAKRRSPGGLRTLRRKTRGGGLLTVLLCTDREERRAAAQNSARLAAPRRAGRLPPSARPLCDDGRRWRERIAASAGVPKTQRRMRPTTTTRCASRARGRGAPPARPTRSAWLGQAPRCPCPGQIPCSASRAASWAWAAAEIRLCSTRPCEQPRRALAKAGGVRWRCRRRRVTMLPAPPPLGGGVRPCARSPHLLSWRPRIRVGSEPSGSRGLCRYFFSRE
jgi:hypothetical protein